MKKPIIYFGAIFAVFLGGMMLGSTASADANVYRMYNKNSGEHFYTESYNEVNSLVKSGWNYEGVGWVAPDGGTPIHRMYNPNAGVHFYTNGISERDSLINAGWRYEGVSFYSGGDIPVYRAYNPNSKAGLHNFSSDSDEQNSLVSGGWKGEGVGFNGVATSAKGKVNAAAYILNWNLVNQGHVYVNSSASKYDGYINDGIAKWNGVRPNTLSKSSDTGGKTVQVSDINEINNHDAVTYFSYKIVFNDYYMSKEDNDEKIHTATHELGHALGLEHLPVFQDMMYRFNSNNTTISPQNIIQLNEAAKRY